MRPPIEKPAKKIVAAGGILLTSALLLWVILILNWPLWVLLFLVLLVSAAFSGCLILRKILLRRREQSFAEEVLEQDQSERQAVAGKTRDSSDELRAQWKRALETLRNSQLKKHGNPLYVLPWYLVVGETGSGKTSSLNGASVSSPVDGSFAPAGLPTGSCDWCFFPDAIVMDTAGRYVENEGEGDREEWHTLLRLLGKYRGREPINGVLVTVAADRLNTETIGSYGTAIRRRIDQMMRVLGVKFPVYLLVTKCDLIPGMPQFAGRLPEQSLDQPMGVLNHNAGADPLNFFATAFADLQRRVRDLRLQLILSDKESAAQLIVFPEEFAKLKAGLEIFCGGAFGANNYQETPIFRGIFFSSAQRISAQGSTPNAAQEEQVRTSGLFLHDLFAKLLPQERSLVAPTRRALEWRKATSSLGLVSWVIFGVAISGLLTFSFVKNLSALRQIPHELTRAVEVKGGAGDLETLCRYRDAVAAVEGINARWWLPRFGLNESLKVERELKNRFCSKFQEGVLAPMDADLERAIVTNAATASDVTYGDCISHLTRRINLLKAALHGDRHEALMAMPQPGYALAVPAAAASDTTPKFSLLYLCYLSWRADSGSLAHEAAALRKELKQLLAQRSGNLQWLAAWVDQRGSAPPVTLAQFWGGSRQVSNDVKVPPSCTLRGKKEIESTLLEMESALPDQHMAKAQRAEFESWHRTQVLASWRSLAAAFPTGAARLNGEREWQQAAAKMASEQNPYFSVLDRMAVELNRYFSEPSPPDWLRQLGELQRVKNQQPVLQSQAVDKVATGGKKLLVSLEKKMGREGSVQNLESSMAACRAYGEYRAALAGIAPAIASRTQAYQAACQLFSEDPAVCKSPLNIAFNAARQLNSALATDHAPDATLSRLVNGPAEFIWSFLRRESSGYLQSQWEEQVLASTLGITGQQSTPILLGQDGLVWKFVKGPAAPFLTRSLRGYRPKEVMGGTLQFEGSFFSFLDGGAQVQAAAMTKQSNYAVGIQGLPTDANHEAKVKPQATRLELQCGASSQARANLNYPVGKTFNWSPDTCGDVTLQIEVGDLVLTKRYAGPQGFPEFLESFAGGTRTFSSHDFPGERAPLQKMGIRQIRVNYQFTGSGPVIRQMKSVCGQLPRNIARCTF
jgi:type VI secretion system protein ImpL